MNYITILGLAAATLTTISFLPQLLTVIKTKSTKDISLATFVIFCVGIFLWLMYGIAIKDAPVIAANAVTFILAGLILFYKLKFK